MRETCVDELSDARAVRERLHSRTKLASMQALRVLFGRGIARPRLPRRRNRSAGRREREKLEKCELAPSAAACCWSA